MSVIDLDYRCNKKYENVIYYECNEKCFGGHMCQVESQLREFIKFCLLHL